MSREAEYAADVMVDDDASDVYVLKIVNGMGHLFHMNARRNGTISAAISKIPLGEVLMALRAPLLELASEQAMAQYDAAPPEVRLMVSLHGNKPLALWLQGYDIEDLKEQFIV